MSKRREAVSKGEMTMTQERMTADEIGDRGDEWYENHIRALVETDENIGKVILIDILTGDYDIDDDRNAVALSEKMHAKNPDSYFYKIRIGYESVYSFGGLRLMPSKR